MSERGQRTTIRFGGVRAEVSLLKTSGKPKAAQHETKRVVVEQPPDPRDGHTAALDAIETLTAREAIPAGVPVMSDGEGGVRAMTTAEAVHGDAAPDVSDAFARADIARSIDRVAERPAPAPSSSPEVDPLGDPTADVVGDLSGMTTAPAPAPTKVLQGVYMPDGMFVDLTDRLAEVDERTKLDGMEVVATIAVNSIHRERVREAHYIGGVNPDEYRVLALLWHGLRQTSRAAAVRWTKRSQQALGIIVARGVLGEDAHLLLLELEWAENMREPGPRVLGPINAEVAPAEAAAAVELVEAFEAGPSALNDLRDERLGKRAELLELAREGKLAAYEPPPLPAPDAQAEDIAAAFAASAAALR